MQQQAYDPGLAALPGRAAGADRESTVRGRSSWARLAGPGWLARAWWTGKHTSKDVDSSASRTCVEDSQQKVHIRKQRKIKSS